MPQLHADTLMDDGDYIEDVPRTPKVRKSKKTAASNQVRLITPGLRLPPPLSE